MILFFLAESYIIMSALMVIITPNPVHSILFLIFTFINSSVLIAYLGGAFMSLLFLIVYVGAIAVLFLFIVMMLNIKIKTERSNSNFFQFFLIFFFGMIFIFIFLMFFDVYFGYLDYSEYLLLHQNGFILEYFDYYKAIESSNLPELMGQVLYTQYVIPFILAGFLLLVAMIGAIVLTVTYKKTTRKQLLFEQISRGSKKAVFKIS
jgi:NADH-quinone oxidoreductase subunit J